MIWLLFCFLTMVSAQDLPEPPDDLEQNDSAGDYMEDCQKDVKDLRNDVAGLEFFLRDKKDYKTYCPQIPWEQPDLETYKTEPKSYLPKDCKTEKI